jgi:pimeloyl-ACP methyl ester carboxylesterase
VPTLLLRSEREPVFLPPAFHDLEKWVPDVRLVEVADAGHFMQRDQPERVNELLIAFARPVVFTTEDTEDTEK